MNQYGMSLHRRGQYLREQQRETKFAPRIFCKGPHIRNFELLSRTILYPDHANPDGTLKEEGISKDDLTKRGFSVFRVKYTLLKVVTDIVDRQVKKNPARSLIGASVFHAETARSIIDKDKFQAFIIIDDSKIQELRGHALILCSEKHKPSVVKELRHELSNIMNDPAPLEDFFAVIPD